MRTTEDFIRQEPLGLSRGRRVGDLYKFLNTGDNKIYAARKIDMKKYNVQDWQREEFEQIMRLESQFLIQTINIFEKNGELYHIMELLEDRTLLRRIPRSGIQRDYLPEDRILSYMKQIGSALCVLKEAEITHLNLWPANIFIRDKEELLVGDFGLAYFWIKNEDKHGERSAIPYMAPEVIADEPYGFGSSADVYSVGCIMYELCTGKKPYEFQYDKEMDKKREEKKSGDKNKENIENIQKNRREWFLKTIRNPESHEQISAQFDSSPSVIEMKYSKGLKDLIISMLNNKRRDRPTPKNIVEKAEQLGIRRPKMLGQISKQDQNGKIEGKITSFKKSFHNLMNLISSPTGDV
ncbi:MAG: hypothetical protein EZS28_033834 [Streblomastix strix]|uniref:Protein kinase domain-containing protein n=1 Tax=Streblomastix strix TaxID=222440 RepID=A0A5J4UJA2_9EUKA|nr:MAG: hypothetical protein EZS28_033834 [Streblomastix strix]